jgi:predicted  nucleic acid-binding Zn-ribbon protein
MLFNNSNLNVKYNDLLYKYTFQTGELEKANDEIKKLMSTIQELRNKVEHLNDQINFVGYDRDY